MLNDAVLGSQNTRSAERTSHAILLSYQSQVMFYLVENHTLLYCPTLSLLSSSSVPTTTTTSPTSSSTISIQLLVTAIPLGSITPPPAPRAWHVCDAHICRIHEHDLHN
jgi:hypothetical protein